MKNDLEHEWTAAKNAFSKFNNAVDQGTASKACESAQKNLQKVADTAAADIKAATTALLKEIK